jgi:hypothetical protein
MRARIGQENLRGAAGQDGDGEAEPAAATCGLAAGDSAWLAGVGGAAACDDGSSPQPAVRQAPASTAAAAAARRRARLGRRAGAEG